MKQKIFFAITLVIACSFITRPFSFTINVLDPKSLTVKASLEKSTAVIQTKGKTSGSYLIKDKISPVRIKIGNTFFQSSMDNPNSFFTASDYINLYKLSSGKTNRSFTIKTDGTTNAALIPVNFIQTGTRENTQLTPAKALIPGEYAFVDGSTTTIDGNITVWCFGIDN